MSNLVVVAIPDENDRVWKVSSEKVPHLTILFLGEEGEIQNFDKIVNFVEHAANTTLNRFYLPVDRRGALGEDPDLGPADVLFFRKNRYDFKAVRDFRAQLLKDSNIRTAYDNTTQFEGPWVPHLTLGYENRPPKEDKEDLPFWDVNFNKIAVWNGDYEGPEFLLKDYWDEYETMETMPMDVAMSSLNGARVEAGLETLEHFGVKGMRWGVRRDRSTSSPGSSSTSTGPSRRAKVGGGLKKVAKDIYFETNWAKDNATDKVTSAASKKWAEEDIPKLNAQYKGTKAATLRSRLKNPLASETIEYRSRSRAAFRDRLNDEVANLSTNASGNRRYVIEDNGKSNANYIWHLKAVDVKRQSGLRHAEEEPTGELLDFRVKILFDQDGLIIGFKQIPLPDEEEAIAQTIDLGADFLAHYGVKGMRWGVHQERDRLTGLPKGEKKQEGWGRYLDPQGHRLSDDIVKVGVGTLVPVVAPLTWPAQIRLIRGAGRGAKAKALDVQEKRFAKKAMSPKNFVAIHNGSSEKFNREIVDINKRYSEADLKNPSKKQKYDGEVQKLLQDSYRQSANAIGNKAGTQHLDVEFHNDGNDFKIHARQGPPTPQPHRVKHAAEDDLANEEITVEITGKIKRDANGYIIGFDFDHLENDTAAHTIDIGSVLIGTFLSDEALAHYGVKGMRWGVRRSGEAPSAVTPSATSHVPHGKKNKTKIKTEGGENHPAHEDAIKVAEARAKLSRSGPKALSNKELREVANRLQLENQVKDLTAPAGKKFVKGFLKSQGQQTLSGVSQKKLRGRFAY